MESESYQYVPIDTIHQENQFMSSKDPCCSGNNGNCVWTTRCDRGPAKESGHALLEDVFYLEHVGEVIVAISDTHLVWRRLEDGCAELVRSHSLSFSKKMGSSPSSGYNPYCVSLYTVKNEFV